jgi:hypothetical protein
MKHDDPYMDRGTDLIAKVRKLREAAQREMNQFTCVADYDVCRLVGRKPPDSNEASPVATDTSLKNRKRKLRDAQGIITFSPLPSESGEKGEGT